MLEPLGLRFVPKAAASRLAGRIARAPASRWLIPWFARHYRVDRSEVLEPPAGYPNLQSFFCRRLRPNARPLFAGPGILVSPVDGTLGAAGRLDGTRLLQAKGIDYSVEALLAAPEEAIAFHGGVFATLYLAPPDYHRVHAPCAGAVARADYIPGAYWPVNPRAVGRIRGLFAGNERLVVYLDSERGRLALVLVGACLVGGIRVSFDRGWNAGPGPHAASSRRYAPTIPFAAGGEIGKFEFGSTVILLAPPTANFEITAAPGRPLRMGEPLAASR